MYLISGVVLYCVVLCCVRNISDLFEDYEHFADTDRSHTHLYRITDHSSHITHIDFKVYTGNLGRKGESKVVR